MKMKGNKIFVKILESSDAEALLRLELRNRDFFQKYTPLRDDDFYTLEGQLDRIRKYSEMKNLDQLYSFGIYLLETGELIGKVTLSEVVRGHLQSCWIGYYLDKDHNGKGYMTEAVRLVVSYAFNELKLHRIEAGVMPHNIGSIRVLEKAGFHKEGIARKNVKINGKWEDHLVLAIVNEEGTEEPAKVTRKNPCNVAPPIGDYTHLSIVPKGADLLVLSGQVGIDAEGNLPSDAEGQMRNALNNVMRILNGEGVTAEGIIKINIWLTEPVERDRFLEIWSQFHGGTPPATTLAYVPSLAQPSLKVEVEAWAARW